MDIIPKEGAIKQALKAVNTKRPNDDTVRNLSCYYTKARSEMCRNWHWQTFTTVTGSELCRNSDIDGEGVQLGCEDFGENIEIIISARINSGWNKYINLIYYFGFSIFGKINV